MDWVYSIDDEQNQGYTSCSGKATNPFKSDALLPSMTHPKQAKLTSKTCLEWPARAWAAISFQSPWSCTAERQKERKYKRWGRRRLLLDKVLKSAHIKEHEWIVHNNCTKIIDHPHFQGRLTRQCLPFTLKPAGLLRIKSRLCLPKPCQTSLCFRISAVNTFTVTAI